MWGSAGGWVHRAWGCPWERGHPHRGGQGAVSVEGGRGKDGVQVPGSLCGWVMLNSELAGSCVPGTPREPWHCRALRGSCPASAPAEGCQMHQAGVNSSYRAEHPSSTGGLCCRWAARGAQAGAAFQLFLHNGATQLSGPMSLLPWAHQLPAGSGLQLLHPQSQQLKIALLKPRCWGGVPRAPAQPAAAALRALGAQGQCLTVGKDRGEDSFCPKGRQRGRMTGRG